jgi:hypothetical protein
VPPGTPSELAPRATEDPLPPTPRSFPHAGKAPLTDRLDGGGRLAVPTPGAVQSRLPTTCNITAPVRSSPHLPTVARLITRPRTPPHINNSGVCFASPGGHCRASTSLRLASGRSFAASTSSCRTGYRHHGFCGASPPNCRATQHRHATAALICSTNEWQSPASSASKSRRDFALRTGGRHRSAHIPTGNKQTSG